MADTGLGVHALEPKGKSVELLTVGEGKFTRLSAVMMGVRFEA